MNRVYIPICVLGPCGFEGGPSGYYERQPGDDRTGPLIVEPGERAYERPKEPDMTTADQDWKTGPLNRQKYVIRKTCKECDGEGSTVSERSGMSLPVHCETCAGQGSTPVDPNAAYFVLRIDGNHDPNARGALAYYAEMVLFDNPEFARGIRAWLDETAVAAD